MRRIIRGTTTFKFAAIGILLLSFIAVLLVYVVRPAVADDGSGRLVTIHDRGQETVILTEAKTIKEALEDAEVAINQHDAVEPALDEQLVAKEYNVNIYRARPVTIEDGAWRHKVITAYQTPEQIIADAGIKLYPEDTTSLKRSNDIVGDGAGLKLSIDRAEEVTLSLYGSPSKIKTQADTVGGLLEEKNITLGEKDRVFPGVPEKIHAGMSIKVWREGISTIAVVEAIPFSVDRIYDADRNVGYKAIKTAGKKGKKSVTYQIEIKNGIEVSRKAIAQLTIDRPTTQIEVIGIGGGITTTPTENEKITWNFFIDQGFTAEQTAGIMGNLMQEHRFSTSDAGPAGFGIAQWLGGRRAGLLAKPNPTSIYTQLEYIMQEFRTTESLAYRMIKAATTVEDATRAFQNYYERCGICVESTRIQYAYGFLSRYR